MGKAPKIESLRGRHEALINRMIDAFQLPRPFVWNGEKDRVQFRYMLYYFRAEDMPENLGVILIDVLRHCDFKVASSEGVDMVIDHLDVYSDESAGVDEALFRNAKIEGFSLLNNEQSALVLEWLQEISMLEGYSLYRQTLKSAIRYWSYRVKGDLDLG